MNDSNENVRETQLVCSPTSDPAVKPFIIAAMTLGFAGYDIYDHYILGNFPKPDPYNLNDHLKYLFNHYIPYLLIPIGLVAIVIGLRNMRRKLVADEKGIHYDGANVAWDEIEELDASQLKDKQILGVVYGGGKRLTLEAWKLKSFRELVAFIEARSPQQTDASAGEEKA